MLEHNRDRGRIKWTAMMLPEHIKRLREWQAEDDYIARPELTEWDLEEIQVELESALKLKCQTLVKIWADGRVTGYQGTIEEIGFHRRLIVLQDPFEIERINAQDIVSVQHVD